MHFRHRSRRLTAAISALALLLVFPLGALAHDPANQHFERTWERTDRPVSTGEVDRTWIWGPSGFTADCTEPYFKTDAGEREVQYFDKSRMEITDPSADQDSEWFVTQGLLATEMITGEMQVGDNERIEWGPAGVHIAGDAGGGSPSYADFAPLMDEPPLPDGSVITQTLDGDGLVGNDSEMAGYDVTAAEYVEATDHRVASVFWELMNSEGAILQDGVSSSGPVFPNPFYAVGLPVTEAYWTNIAVAGVQQDVLVQAFERRVLTYTPGNDPGWRVEAGNVGQHYYIWRYGEIPHDSDDACPGYMHVTFNVYAPDGVGGWEQIAVTTTREVWHPDNIASGTWTTYAHDDGELLVKNSAGILVADHTYTTVLGQRILSGLSADVEQVDGPTPGTARIEAGEFSLGDDPRVSGSLFVGSGSLSYQTPDESGELSFEVAGTSANTFHVFLDGPPPPVFFR